MATVNVYYAQSNLRSIKVAQNAALGLKKLGYRVKLQESALFKKVDTDFAVFYGFGGYLRSVYEAYRREATAIYVDLGYWRRRIKSRYDGYYKMAINDRHPNAYFQKFPHERDRFNELGVNVLPWKVNDDGPIILAGMSEKAARAEGLDHQVWERNAFNRIRRVTDRPIIYRPKPSCCRSRPIKNAMYDKRTPTEELLKTAFAVVARHSNMAVEAICAGVPAFVDTGVALPMSAGALRDIENPVRHPKRMEWASDIAYCQWSLAEIGEGLPFIHFKEEGLIP
jgi:hypothetical protein